MYLKEIVSGTEFEIVLNNGHTVIGTLDESIDHMNFYLHCPEILANIDKLAKTEATIKFAFKEKYYAFSAEILRKSSRSSWNQETLDMTLKSPIKESSSGEELRIKIGIKIKIYNYVDNRENFFVGNRLFEATSEDLSKGGVRIWSDWPIDDPVGTMFTLELSSPLRVTYLIPAKLVRNQQNTTTRTYNYDYLFALDFSHNPDQQDKMIVDALEAKLRHSGKLK